MIAFLVCDRKSGQTLDAFTTLNVAKDFAKSKVSDPFLMVFVPLVVDRVWGCLYCNNGKSLHAFDIKLLEVRDKF